MHVNLSAKTLQNVALLLKEPNGFYSTTNLNDQLFRSSLLIISKSCLFVVCNYFHAYIHLKFSHAFCLSK